METSRHNGTTIACQPQDRETAQRLLRMSEKVLPMVSERWGLKPPAELWLYVMDEAWIKAIFFSAPPIWRALLGLMYPIWYNRTRRMWPYAGGWQQQFGRRSVVGIKPPRLLQTSDRSLGQRIYVPEPDLNLKVEHLASHELTHALTARLRLPAWLNEGLAMVAVDQYLGKASVKSDTLSALRSSTGKASPGSYLRVQVSDPDAMVYLYVRGYWIVRYLEETQPGLLKGLLQRRRSHAAIETELARALGMRRPEFWRNIDGRVVKYFEKK